MPRKASDKTITHRIELGLPERAELKEIIATENFVNDIVQPIADPITNKIVKGMKEEVEESQNFVVNARNKVNSFCDPNSIHYDEDKCNQAQIEYEAAKIQAKETQEAVLAQAQAIKDEITAFREGEDSILQLLPFGKAISKAWSIF